ncbi:MAG TPA: hypothetical protein VE890_11290 [Thermoguttaceae bacterium]|nr:hypothetical protein [Thermoguttaceae bacterium]
METSPQNDFDGRTHRIAWLRGLSRLARPVRRAVASVAARPSMWSLFDQALVSGTSFVTTVCIGRMCSKDELGVYYLGLSIFYIVRGIQGQTVSAPYLVYCNRRRDAELASYSGSSLAHQAVFSMLTMAFLAVLACVLSMGIGPAALASVVWVLLGVMPFLLLREYTRRFSFAHLRLPVAIAIDATVAALQLGSLVLLAYFGGLSVLTAFVVMGGACAVASVGWLLSKRHSFRFSGTHIVADWWHNWSFAKWALAGDLIGYSAPYIMPWIVVTACGETATGMLAACATLIGLANTFVMGVGNYLTPKAAKTYSSEGLDALCHLLTKTALMFVATLGGFALLVLLAGDYAAVFVYGSDYAGTGAGVVMTILALEMLAMSMGLTVGAGLWAMERPSANFAADVCTLTVTITTAICLVHPLGIVGAAAAALLGTSTGALVRFLTFMRLVVSTSSDPVAVSS